MAKKKLVPSYRLHKPTGQAVVTIRLPDGGSRDVYLGAHNSPESRVKYNQVLDELSSTSTSTINTSRITARRLDPTFTVDQLIQAFWEYAKLHYRDKEGKPTTELAEIKRSLSPLRDLYAVTPASEFGPLRLAEVRKHMIANDWCRSLINRRMDRVKRAFKWAVSVELVPVTVHQALATLSGLKKGRTEARESRPIKPVDRAIVTATLPFLSRHVRTMVELQQLTGMRPGEVCGLSFNQIDRTSELWVYRPSQHKNAHRGKDRVIPIGPRAQALLIAFLVGDNPPPAGLESIDLSIDPKVTVFSPIREREERFQAMRESRISKVQPSQINRRKAKPKRVPAAAYQTISYTAAIARGAKKAGVPHWHPNQLRHAIATEVRKGFGIEATGAFLGHSKMSATEVYAERDYALAARVAQAIG